MIRYRTTLRPAGFATIPEGVTWQFVEAPHDDYWQPLRDLPRSRHRYGVIETDRPLTQEEMDHFDIVEVTQPCSST